MARPKKSAAHKEHEVYDRKLLPAFGERVAALRRAKNWTFALAASQIGCSTKNLDNIEKGRNWPSMSIYLQILRVYGQKAPTLIS